MGSLFLSGARQDYAYSITDLVGNTASNSFSIYRLPNISDQAIFQTGGQMYYQFSSDLSTPLDFQYASTGTGMTTLTVNAVPGVNTLVLTGITMT